MCGRSVPVLLLVLACASTAWADAFQQDSILVSSGNNLFEYTRDGSLLQTIAIPAPGDSFARDLVVNQATGEALVYNGTFDPFLSTLEPVASSWSHRTATGWSTVNNVTYGGIATDGTYAYVTDMRTFGDGGADEAMGVVRFELGTSTWTRFAEDIEPIDLNLGRDGLLYAMHPGGSPGGLRIDVYNPATLTFIRQIDLGATLGHTGHRALAVNAAGELFVGDPDGDLQYLDPNGALIDSTDLNAFLADVDVAADGTVLVADYDGGIYLTDATFGTVDSFTVSGASLGSFAAFVPEPSTVMLLATGFVLLRRRRG